MRQSPKLILLAALAEKNRVIGKDGKLPWHISEDLKRFKRLTVGNPVLMGRKTFESILQRNGKPLPERKNIVLTTSRRYPDLPNVATYPSLDCAMNGLADEERVFIIGGEKVFAETLLLAHRLELTIVEDDYDGDAFFPDYEYLIGGRFRLVQRQERDGYRFESYELVE